MVALTAILLGYAALSSYGVLAAPFDQELVTPVPDTIELDALHPAYGAPIDTSLYPPTVSRNTSTEVDGPGFEESAFVTPDVQRLEQYFGRRMEYRWDALPTSGKVKMTPWPSSYWPVYADGINARWYGSEPSPAEKYARAYGLNVQAFMDRVSQSNGILSPSRRKSCQSDADCYELNDRSKCGKREGQSTGYCIPMWFGICHAWAPAAILEPEPKCAVKVNNAVIFRPFDIKALMTQVYDNAGVQSVFTGLRYDGPTNAAIDDYGRFADRAYRDLNPGYFHLAVTNMIGRYQQSFVADVTAHAEVWNQPARSYEILQQTALTRQQAGAIYNKPDYPFNPAATSLLRTRMRFAYVLEAGEDGSLVADGRVDRYTTSKEYEYLLELDGYGQIIGGEWLGNSHKDHPDFLWFPTGRPADNAMTKLGLSYKNVRELLMVSANGQC